RASRVAQTMCGVIRPPDAAEADDAHHLARQLHEGRLPDQLERFSSSPHHTAPAIYPGDQASRSYRIGLIPYHNGMPRGRESDEAVAGRTTLDGGPGPGPIPGVSAPGREDALARHLAVAPARPSAHPGPGGRPRRPVGHRRPPHPPPVESARPGEGGPTAAGG